MGLSSLHGLAVCMNDCVVAVALYDLAVALYAELFVVWQLSRPFCLLHRLW